MPVLRPRFTTVDEGFAYIESFTNFERSTDHPIRSYRLDRMRALLALFDHPDRGYRTIHLAGSKGKGSTAAFVASILDAAGYKTGLYASPHVATYRERITLAGRFLDDRLYLDGINRIAARLAELDHTLLPGRGSPTTFELLTLLAFLLFREVGCEWAVIETGIGGRLDATNVITPEVCLLTPVELEHTELLGTTLWQIAGEKAGIIKDGVEVFVGLQKPDPREVFAATALLKHAPIHFLADEATSLTSLLHLEGTDLSVQWADGRRDDLKIGMAGEVQAENAALALLAVRSLRLPRPITEANIAVGLATTQLPGRMEIVPSAEGPVVLDGAHTPVSVARLLAAHRALFPEPGVLIFGSVAGKNPQEMADVLAPAFASIIVSTPGTFKKSDPEGVFELFHSRNAETQLVKDPREALERARALARARGGGTPILVTGSFYMVAEIRRLIVAD